MKYQVLGNKGLNKGGSNKNEKVGSDSKNKGDITEVFHLRDVLAKLSLEPNFLGSGFVFCCTTQPVEFLLPTLVPPSSSKAPSKEDQIAVVKDTGDVLAFTPCQIFSF